MTDDREVVVYSVGIVAASVCAKEAVSRETVEAHVNRDHPTGIMSRWSISDESFADGSPNPSPCNAEVGRVHWLLDC